MSANKPSETFLSILKDQSRKTNMALIFCAIAICLSLYSFYVAAITEPEQILVLDPTTRVTYSARSEYTIQDKQIEAEGQLADFTSLMFGFDKGNFFSNVEAAQRISGLPGVEIGDYYAQSKYHDKISAGDLRIDVVIDSLSVDVTKEPMEGRVIARRIVSGVSESAMYNLIAKAKLQTTSRTPFNRHGFIIVDWEWVNQDMIGVKEH